MVLSSLNDGKECTMRKVQECKGAQCNFGKCTLMIDVDVLKTSTFVFPKDVTFRLNYGNAQSGSLQPFSHTTTLESFSFKGVE